MALGRACVPSHCQRRKVAIQPSHSPPAPSQSRQLATAAIRERLQKPLLVVRVGSRPCHSERSEESVCIAKTHAGGFFTAFRMTVQTIGLTFGLSQVTSPKKKERKPQRLPLPTKRTFPHTTACCVCSNLGGHPAHSG